MFGKSIELFEIFGFKVKLDLSWTILALLIAWSLAQGFFPALYEGLPVATYWWMGVAGTIGLFISIVFHELSHSLVARRYDIPMGGITLFIFGGVAEMSEEPQQPKAELLMAIAGPISSVLLGGLFAGIAFVGQQQGWPQPFTGVMDYLALLNIVLAVFNMLPAYPLDGGRVLRAALWHWKGDIRKATRIAAKSGSIFGLVLIVLGILSFVTGNFVGGIWWVLIGLFLRGAANSSYMHTMVRQQMKGRSVREFMNGNPVAAPGDISVRRFVDDYVYRHDYGTFPITEGKRLIGCVKTSAVRQLPRDQWDDREVHEIASKCDSSNTIEADADAAEALNRMRSGQSSKVMVTENGELVGILSLQDLIHRLQLQEDLEG